MKSTSRMALISLTVAVCLLRLHTGSAGSSTTTVNTPTRAELEQIFGTCVDAERNLFEINASVAAHLLFAPNGDLAAVKVAPKHFFEDLSPNWLQPDERRFLSPEQYEALIAKILARWPLGTLLHRTKVAVVTNLRAPYLSRFTNGYLQVAYRIDLRVDPTGTKPPPIHDFNVYYLRQVTGKVTRIERYEEAYKVCLDKLCYLIPFESLQHVAVGQTVTVNAAGPTGPQYQ